MNHGRGVLADRDEGQHAPLRNGADREHELQGLLKRIARMRCR
jgi:hypothetical protein